MKAILYAISIALIAVGVAVGLMVLTNAANVVIGLTLETAAILISGGFIVLGLASVTAALFAVVDAIEVARRPAGCRRRARARPDGLRSLHPGNGRDCRRRGSRGRLCHPVREPREEPAPAGRGYVPAATSAWKGQLREPEPAVTGPTGPWRGSGRRGRRGYGRRRIPRTCRRSRRARLRGDRSHCRGRTAAGRRGGGLYVVEEKIIRGKPARILSDGTVEAETDEGWMRFENMEHLEEYLDATTPV